MKLLLTMKLLGSTKQDIAKDKDREEVPKLEAVKWFKQWKIYICYKNMACHWQSKNEK